jgi:hypothetical protein
MARMDAAAGTANEKVLLHATTSRAVVHSSLHVAIAVVDFHGRLGIERGRQSLRCRCRRIQASPTPSIAMSR